MSYKDSDLSSEIKDEIGLETAANGIRIDADQIAFRVIRKHFDDFAKHTVFVSNAVWGHVRKVTGAEPRKWRDDSDISVSQPDLAGFDRLQDYYEVESQEGSAVRLQRVRRDALTTVQRRKIAEDLRHTGTAYINHGNEFDRETDELIAAGKLEPDED